MTWPKTRLRTYTPGLPIRSADLNAIQDAIINGKHGFIERGMDITPVDSFGTSAPLPGAGGRHWVLYPGDGWRVHLPLIAGETLQNIRLRVRDDTEGIATLRLRRYNESTIDLSLTQVSNGSNELQWVAIDRRDNELTLTDEQRFIVEIENTGASETIHIRQLRYTYARL